VVARQKQRAKLEWREPQLHQGNALPDGRISLRQGHFGHYRVRIDGEWIDVPDDAVITESNRADRTMVWPTKGSLGISIRCFMPGSMT
jgi:hypothetical protein